MRRAGSGPIIMLSPLPADVGRQFPAVSEWVQRSGWIEVGRQAESGFVVRAFDESGLVFENSSTSLAEALAALEEGLAGRIRGEDANLRCSLPRVEK